jgi:hypothetical protein
MRLSIVRQYWSVEHVYLQKPPTHFFGVAAVPPHCSSLVQFGFGRVSIAHAPWLQYLPSPHSASPLHAFPHAPARQFGVGLEHCASPVQVPPVADGLHTPLSHVKPSPQDAASQLARHWPSAHTFPSPHSLEYLHVFFASVQVPDTQAWPLAQSVAVWQGQGPAVPPQAWHAPPMHVLPPEQSAFVVHSLVVPTLVPGAEQKPPVQVSPCGQFELSTHCAAQPVVVQTEPGGHEAFPEQAARGGAETFEQP